MRLHERPASSDQAGVITPCRLGQHDQKGDSAECSRRHGPLTYRERRAGDIQAD
jgi:hypothetical protein